MGTDVEGPGAAVQPHPLHGGPSGVKVAEAVESRPADGLGVSVGEIRQRIDDPPSGRFGVQEKGVVPAGRGSQPADGGEPQLGQPRRAGIGQLGNQFQLLPGQRHPVAQLRVHGSALEIDQRGRVTVRASASATPAAPAQSAEGVSGSSSVG